MTRLQKIRLWIESGAGNWITVFFVIGLGFFTITMSRVAALAFGLIILATLSFVAFSTNRWYYKEYLKK